MKEKQDLDPKLTINSTHVSTSPHFNGKSVLTVEVNQTNENTTEEGKNNFKVPW